MRLRTYETNGRPWSEPGSGSSNRSRHGARADYERAVRRVLARRRHVETTDRPRRPLRNNPHRRVEKLECPGSPPLSLLRTPRTQTAPTPPKLQSCRSHRRVRYAAILPKFRPLYIELDIVIQNLCYS